jgi:hypothetical protein
MQGTLFIQLAVATVMVVVTALMHLTGLGVLIWLLRRHGQRFPTLKARLNGAVILAGSALGLFALHTLEMWTYAALYVALHATSTFESALYLSIDTYTSVGFGDVLIAREWRVLGAIEAASGIILFGWSTAFFVSVVARIRLLEHDWFGESASRHEPDEAPPIRTGSRRPGRR